MPAAPDVQGNTANFKPLLRRCGPGRGWRLVGGKILGQHVAGETVVSVCDGAPQAVKFQQALIAAWMIWAGHQWIRALVKVALSRAGMVRAFAWASCRQKVAVSWLQRPPTSMVNTSLQRRVRRSSGYVCFSIATGRQLLDECKLPPLGNILRTMSTTRWLGFSLAFNVLWMKCPCAHGDGSSSLPAPSKYAHYCVMLPPLRWVSNNLKFGYWRVKVGRIWRAKICLHKGHRFEKAAAIFSHVLGLLAA